MQDRKEIILEKCKELNIKIHSIETENKRQYVYYSMPNEKTISRKRIDHFIDKFKIIPIQPYNKNAKNFIGNKKIRKDIEILSEYMGWNQPIKCRCKNCNNIWFPSANKLLKGQGCPICAKKRIAQKFTKTNKQFLKELEEKNLGIINIEPYAGAFKIIKFKCLKCDHIWEATPDSVLKKSNGCIICGASQGERLIAKALERLNIEYETQKTFKDCISLGKLRFDFYLPKYNVCIEYQGSSIISLYVFQKKIMAKKLRILKIYKNEIKSKKDFVKKTI